MVEIVTKTYSDRKRGRFQSGGTRSTQRHDFNGLVFSLPHRKIVDGSIEAGLICLAAWGKEHPGRTLSRDEIAFVCGCSDTIISRLENSALKKLKRRLKSLEMVL